MSFASVRDLEDELELELQWQPRIRVRYVRGAAESEIERFDPAPPRRGTILLTRFAFGSAAPIAEHRTVAGRIASAVVAKMVGLPSFTGCVFLDIEGHEDEVGDPARFGVLGSQRAIAILNLIRARLPVAGARLPAASRRKVIVTISSAGPVRPIRSNATEEGRALNRRVEVRIRSGDCPGIA